MQVRVNWLFESDIFGEDIKGIVEEVKRQGHNAILMNRLQHFSSDDYTELFKPDDCVIFYGSIGLSEQIKKETEWVPGSIHTTNNFLWSTYSFYFSQFLLAQEFTLVKYKDLPTQKDWLYQTFGKEETVFMRPDSGNKPFAGQLMELKHFDSDVPRMGYGDISPDEAVIVSPPVDIDTEWRFIVADRQVIAGSQYLPFKMRLHTKEEDTVSGTLYQSCKDDNDALTFANRVVDSVAWEPDRLWTLDVCKTSSGNYYVIEINSFSCSGFYKCNRQEIVTHASRIAANEWGKKHGLSDT